jgi:predicted lipoprotein with Yx(FWY)xxD motif
MRARALTLAPVVAALLAWTGSGDLSSALGRDAASLSSRATTKTVIRSTYNSAYGQIVLSPHRHSVYIFCITASHKCPGHHARGWSPLIARGLVVAAPHSKINSSELGTVRLESGRRQVTYYGHRLYLYRGDHKAGQIKGEGIYQEHGQWWLIWARGGAIANPTTY